MPRPGAIRAALSEAPSTADPNLETSARPDARLLLHNFNRAYYYC